MESDESSASILRGERRTAVEKKVERCPVRRVTCDRVLESRAAIGLFSIASVFRCDHQLRELDRVVAVRPAEVVAAIYLEHRFRGIVGAVGGIRKNLWPAFVQLVAA